MKEIELGMLQCTVSSINIDFRVSDKVGGKKKKMNHQAPTKKYRQKD